jgi:chaperonin GroES
MRLLGTKIAIKQEVSAPTTKGGLALPDNMQQKLPQGVVVAVGQDVNEYPTALSSYSRIQVEVGAHVLFNNFAVQGVIVDGQEYAIIDVDDIQVIL